jgi:hypothetical protein
MISRREEEIVGLPTFPTSNEEISHFLDSRRADQFYPSSSLRFRLCAYWHTTLIAP